jgi:hypothetical protein
MFMVIVMLFLGGCGLVINLGEVFSTISIYMASRLVM